VICSLLLIFHYDFQIKVDISFILQTRFEHFEATSVMVHNSPTLKNRKKLWSNFPGLILSTTSLIDLLIEFRLWSTKK
jgi:hypothetical protein